MSALFVFCCVWHEFVCDMFGYVGCVVVGCGL